MIKYLEVRIKQESYFLCCLRHEPRTQAEAFILNHALPEIEDRPIGISFLGRRHVHYEPHGWGNGEYEFMQPVHFYIVKYWLLLTSGDCIDWDSVEDPSLSPRASTYIETALRESR